jgi:hypothetical protein
MYEVNDVGEIRRVLYFPPYEFKEPQVIKQRMTGGGQVSVNLCTTGSKRIVAPVARLVAMTFHSNEYKRLLPSLGRSLVCLHLDGDSWNNTASNLNWGTLSGTKHKGSKHVSLNEAEILALDTEQSPVMLYGTIDEAANALGVQGSGIHRALRDDLLCGGYFWRRVPKYGGKQ